MIARRLGFTEPRLRHPLGSRRGGRVALVLVPIAAAVASYVTAARPAVASGHPGRGAIPVLVTLAGWGSLAAQLGGPRVSVTEAGGTPDTDPRHVVPTARTALDLASARLVIRGGGGDAWARTILPDHPVPGRVVLTVGPRGGGDPSPYSPGDVRAVVDEITAEYCALDPGSADTFHRLHDVLIATGLKPYLDLVAQIRRRFAGTPVGASEALVVPLARATGLRVVTPPAFLAAIAADGVPPATAVAAAGAQITHRRLKVYVENSQYAPSAVQRQVDAVTAAGIPIVPITQTPAQAGMSFQLWQVSQLKVLAAALAWSTGR